LSIATWLPGRPWTAVWYYEGSEVYRDSLTWTDGIGWRKNDQRPRPEWTFCPERIGLSFIFRIGSTATSDFTLAGAQQGALRLKSSPILRFTTAIMIRMHRRPQRITSFSTGTSSIIGLFDWERDRARDALDNALVSGRRSVSTSKHSPGMVDCGKEFQSL